MRAPQSYIEELHDKTFKELLEIRNKLLNEIKDFEKNIEEIITQNVFFDPTPDVVYQWKLLVLSKLFDLLQNKFNKEFINFDD